MDFTVWRKNWRYKNLALFLIGLGLVYALSKIPSLQQAISHVGEWGYVGAIITGIFYVITFTTVPAIALLYNFSLFLNPFELALLAGLGSVIGDFLIFSFFRHRVFIELEPIRERMSKTPFKHILESRYFMWLSPVLGAIIIASPIPDEFGVPLLSASKLKQWHFIILTFVLNSLGIWILLTGLNWIF